MEIKCEFFEVLEKVECKVTSIKTTEPGSKIKSIIGTFPDKKTYEDVARFYIWDENLEAFPENISSLFPNLSRLEIKNCGLKKISRSDLIGLENIESLLLMENELTTLPDDLFVDMKNLKHIHFNDNKLENLSSNLLKPIESNLLFADFSNNTKIDELFVNRFSGNLKLLMEKMDLTCTSQTEAVPKAKSRCGSKTGSKSETKSSLPPKPKPRKIHKNNEVVKKSNKTFEKSDERSVRHTDVFKKFESFRAARKYTDFTIKVYGKEFAVHKNVLAAQSQVFDALFSNETASKNFTKIKNLSVDSFEHFLDYFYTGQVDSEADLLEIFELASEFGVIQLAVNTAVNIMDNLDESNALEVFNIGRRHAVEAMKQAAFEIIKKKFPDMADELIDQPDFVNEIVKAVNDADLLLV